MNKKSFVIAILFQIIVILLSAIADNLFGTGLFGPVFSICWISDLVAFLVWAAMKAFRME